MYKILDEKAKIIAMGETQMAALRRIYPDARSETGIEPCQVAELNYGTGYARLWLDNESSPFLDTMYCDKYDLITEAIRKLGWTVKHTSDTPFEWIVKFTVADVFDVRPDLTVEQSEVVLRTCQRNYDPEIGISIKDVADYLYPSTVNPS